jgi:hypothetical protein
LRVCLWSECLSCVPPAMRSADVTPRRLPRPMLAVVLVLWYGALIGLNAVFGDPGRVSLPGIAVFYGLWTLPGLAIPLRTAFRSGVLEALAVPLGTATGISAVAFASSGLFSCRPGASRTSDWFLAGGSSRPRLGRLGGSRSDEPAGPVRGTGGPRLRSATWPPAVPRRSLRLRYSR